MTTHWFCLTLLNDVVVSAAAATTGGHQCLDYIPGSTVLGAIAAHFCKHRERTHPCSAHELFYNASLRCTHAYPYIASENNSHHSCDRARPMPLSLHLPKGEKSGRALNAALQPLPNDDQTQWQQQRLGYLFNDHRLYTPRRVNRMKTAIDRDKVCRAKEAQLFEYQALPAGSTWAFSLSFADQVSHLEKEIVAFLLSSTIRVGRSRSAEYGAVKISTIQPVLPPKSEPLPSRCIIYLASDTALSTHGLPRLIPQPSDFGLPASACVDWHHTFLRSRSYAPYNAFRRAYDCQRVLLQKGSVICFACPDGYDAAAVAARCAAGVGLYTNEGFGEVYVNPSWLTQPHVDIQLPEKSMTKSEQIAAKRLQQYQIKLQNHSTFQLMNKRYLEIRHTPLAMQLGEDWGKKWFTSWQKALDNALDGRVPTKTQWSNLRAAAVAALAQKGDRLEHFKKLLEDKKDGVFHHGLASKLWTASTGRSSLNQDIIKALDINRAHQLIKAEIPEPTPDIVDLVAVRACYYAAIHVVRKISEHRA